MASWFFISNAAILYRVLDQNGNNLLPYNGVNVNQDNYPSFMYYLIPSDSNTAIIIYCDGRTGVYYDYDVYAQKINSLGERLWGPNGVLLCDLPGAYLGALDAVTDSAGGAFAVIGAADWDVYLYMQHIDSSGVVQWDPNGVLFREHTGYGAWSDAVPDLQGGVMVIYEDYETLTTDPADLRKQHIDANGNLLWGFNGQPFCWQSGSQANAYMYGAISDGQGGGGDREG